jgi:hypothetical protein
MGLWSWSSTFDVECWKGSSSGHIVVDRKVGPGTYTGNFTPSMQTMERKGSQCANPPPTLVSGRVVYKVRSDSAIDVSIDGGEYAPFAWDADTLGGKASGRQTVGTKQ